MDHGQRFRIIERLVPRELGKQVTELRGNDDLDRVFRVRRDLWRLDDAELLRRAA